MAHLNKIHFNVTKIAVIWCKEHNALKKGTKYSEFSSPGRDLGIRVGNGMHDVMAKRAKSVPGKSPKRGTGQSKGCLCNKLRGKDTEVQHCDLSVSRGKDVQKMRRYSIYKNKSEVGKIVLS